MDEPRGLTRRTLIASGMSENSIRRALRSGELANVAHGLYLWRKDFDALGTVERHRVHARHVGSGLHTDEAISHISAAALHGIDVWDVPLHRVHVSRPPSRSGRVTAGLHAHTTHWDDGEITQVLGVPVTSIARTVVDLARTLPRDEAVAVGDAALRLDPGAASQIARVLEASRCRYGLVSASSVLQLLDGRSDSIGESLSRIRMREYGLPVPDLQRDLITHDGRPVRVGFYWEDLGVVGQFDDNEKYTEPRDLIDEKRRDDGLRDLGLEVVRWEWTELEQFEVVARRFERAVDRSRARAS